MDADRASIGNESVKLSEHFILGPELQYLAEGLSRSSGASLLFMLRESRLRSFSCILVMEERRERPSSFFTAETAEDPAFLPFSFLDGVVGGC